MVVAVAVALVVPVVVVVALVVVLVVGEQIAVVEQVGVGQTDVLVDSYLPLGVGSLYR